VYNLKVYDSLKWAIVDRIYLKRSTTNDESKNCSESTKITCVNKVLFAESDIFFYFRGMNKFKSFVEWNAFGVCTAIGNRMGIATSRIRQYFMYASLLTMGSPIIIYLVLAFWRNMKKYIIAAKRNPWYYL